jgi:DHA1 family multidrug resistance protein-like MFS transporter
MRLTSLLMVVSIYMSFVYALLYMLMAAIPIIFGELRGLPPMIASLPLIAVFIGIVCGGSIILLDLGRYKRMLLKMNATSLPEQRFVWAPSCFVRPT